LRTRPEEDVIALREIERIKGLRRGKVQLKIKPQRKVQPSDVFMKEFYAKKKAELGEGEKLRPSALLRDCSAAFRALSEEELAVRFI
jgi:hypothetical protein